MRGREEEKRPAVSFFSSSLLETTRKKKNFDKNKKTFFAKKKSGYGRKERGKKQRGDSEEKIKKKRRTRKKEKRKRNVDSTASKATTSLFCRVSLLFFLLPSRRRQFLPTNSWRIPFSSPFFFLPENPPRRCDLLDEIYAFDKRITKTKNNVPFRRGGPPSWSRRRPTASCAAPRCSG